MKTVIIVQARMTSTRLPGKVLKEVLGKSLLEYQLERLKRVKLADDIIIATTENATDLPIVALCKKLNVNYFRGSEHDVLARYYHAAKCYEAGIVIRITADCPVIDPQIVDNIIQFYIDNRNVYDYVSTGDDSYPRGMNTEVFSFKVLEEAFVYAVKEYEREHVTPYMYQHPEKYKVGILPYKEDESQHRWTVDTPEDFALIKKIIENLYPIKRDFDLKDCLALVNRYPAWGQTNQHVKQKKLGE